MLFHKTDLGFWAIYSGGFQPPQRLQNPPARVKSVRAGGLGNGCRDFNRRKGMPKVKVSDVKGHS
jgi:hypothetical protein